MRNAVAGLALVFVALMVFGTVYVMIRTGPDLFTGLALLVILVLGFGIFGALGGPGAPRG